MILKDRVAIITGAGRGIGEVIAKHFAQVGAAVVCSDIDEESVNRVAEAINGSGGRAVGIRGDVSSKSDVDALVQQVLADFGKIDILINNAGITRDSLAMRMKESDWDLVTQVNLKGTWLPSQAVIRPMRKNKWGRIINTSSVASLGNVGQANYSATKGAVISLTKTLALELATSGITVNCVAPGAIMTEMFNAVPDDIKAQYIERIPLGRFGDPKDVADAHLFLCSDAASYITGQTLFVDGGISVGM